MKKISTLIALLVSAFWAQAQIGKVGINTSSPLAMLHVKDSNVLFSGPATLPVPAFQANPPVSGAGTRMMWYPDKAAFRAGKVSSTEWDKSSIGNFSFAVGQNTTASGDNSTSFGNQTISSGNYSTAIGDNTVASNISSVAMGSFSTASGTYSTAVGFNSLASGSSSTAMGENSIASGLSSMAMGRFTTASGIFSTAMGNGSHSSGIAATALGNNTVALGLISTTMGNSSLASGDISTSMGERTTARAYGSLTIGRLNDSILTSNKTSWVVTDPVFIIGNGTATNARSNAMVVYKNGNTDINGNLKLNNGNAVAGAVLTATDNLGNSNWESTAIGFSANLSADVFISNNSFVNLVFNSQGLDDGGDNFNPATGVYTVPSAGMYQIEVSVYWNGLTGTENLYLNINGVRRRFTSTPIATGAQHTQKLSTLLKLNTGDQVGAQVQQNSGAAILIDNATGGTYFSGAKLY